MKRVSPSIHSKYKDMNIFLAIKTKFISAITLFPAISSCCKIPFAQYALLKSDENSCSLLKTTVKTII